MFALEGICKVAQLYYQTLTSYMDALFSLTTNSVGKEEQIAIRAIEFWNVICEVRACRVAVGAVFFSFCHAMPLCVCSCMVPGGNCN